MTILHERMPVLYGPLRDQRGIILEIKGETCSVVGPDRQLHSAVSVECEPFPMTMCFLCGVQDSSPDEVDTFIARSEVVMKRDFGAVAPPERRLPFCEPCMKKVYEEDQAIQRCNCAHSWGKSTVCTCEWRRSRGFQP